MEIRYSNIYIPPQADRGYLFHVCYTCAFLAQLEMEFFSDLKKHPTFYFKIILDLKKRLKTTIHLMLTSFLLVVYFSRAEIKIGTVL